MHFTLLLYEKAIVRAWVRELRLYWMTQMLKN